MSKISNNKIDAKLWTSTYNFCSILRDNQIVRQISSVTLVADGLPACGESRHSHVPGVIDGLRMVHNISHYRIFAYFTSFRRNKINRTITGRTKNRRHNNGSAPVPSDVMYHQTSSRMAAQFHTGCCLWKLSETSIIISWWLSALASLPSSKSEEEGVGFVIISDLVSDVGWWLVFTIMDEGPNERHNRAHDALRVSHLKPVKVTRIIPVLHSFQ